MDASLDRWIAAHSYLTDLARFLGAVDGVVAAAAVPAVALPPGALDAYAPDHARGVPLLRSAAAGLDLAPAGAAVAAVAGRLAGTHGVPEKLRREAGALGAALGAAPARAQALAFLIGAGGAGAPANPGLLRFLGWTTLRVALAPALRAYSAWREEAAALGGEDPWLRGECPTCGAPPAMAQLIGSEEGRRRVLACGNCGSRWGYRRTGCPFCGNESPDRLGVLELEGEDRLRLDICESCAGYLKTYVGKGEEGTFLADWTTLHLDVLARERGLNRVGGSLYEL